MNFPSLTKPALLTLAAGLSACFAMTDKAHALTLDAGFVKATILSAYSDSIVAVNTDGNDPEGAKAQKMIEKMGNEGIAFLSDPNISLSEKEKRFRKILDNNFDMQTIGRFVMGRNWKVATEQQRKEYQKLFEDLVVKVYSARFDEYQGEDFAVENYQSTGKSDYMVTSYIVPANGSKVKVDWRVRNKNGTPRVIDIIIEGVSMTVTQRSEFASVIQRGGGDVEVLLAHLRE